MKLRPTLLLLAILAPATSHILAQQTAPPATTAPAAATVVKNLTPEEASKLLKDTQAKVKILDVRTAKEHAAEKLENGSATASNVDFRAADFESQLAGLDKKQPWLVHCKSGGRSTSSLEILKKLGFSTIYHLDGGIEAWKKAGLPTKLPSVAK